MTAMTRDDGDVGDLHPVLANCQPVPAGRGLLFANCCFHPRDILMLKR
jgi:hypothetical protein